MLEAAPCYRALTAKDARFDGVFFVGVTTTGIYCRPVCPARTPRRERCRFFRTGAEAEREGFRACFRCRPERAPAAAPSASPLVAGAAARIEQGALCDGSVDDLAADLGVSARHLRRAMHAELGISPIELAEARRLALAKQLVCDGSLPMTEIAFASGFRSLRRFNSSFKERFARSPSELRKSASPTRTSPRDSFTLRLDYRPPYDWPAVRDFLGARACAGVERAGESIARTLRIGARRGWLIAVPEGDRSLRVEIATSLTGALMPLVAALRRWLDLDAHPDRIAAHLGADRLLARHVARRPGLRVPGAIDAFEIAVRAILGQQISVAAARTLAGRFAAAFGERIVTPDPSLTHLWPSARRIASSSAAAIAALGVLPARAASIALLAKLVTRAPIRDRGEPERTLAELRAVGGIGEWTLQYIAMRALGWPDAFPAGDRVLCRALGLTAPELAVRAEAWRPWRAYAVMHLWTAESAKSPRRKS